MSRPPLNPEKTTSGIILDPKTLDRVVPQSKRRDGTVRKELKIRPGFTPQEDVGLFRPTRATTPSSSKPNYIPGTTRIKPPTADPLKPENPFAQPAAAKSKAALKNEKRRAKKAVVVKDWDESSGEDEDGTAGGVDGDLKEVFENASKGRDDGAEGAQVEGTSTEGGFPELGGGGGAPDPSIAAVTTAAAPGAAESSSPLVEIGTRNETTKTAALEPSPGMSAVPETAAEVKVPSRADGEWRTSVYSVGRGAKGGVRGGGRTRGGPPGSATRNGATPPPAKPKEEKKEERVRREVKVREGGPNDLSSLAARVRGLVIENQKPRSPRQAKGQDQKA